MSLIDNIKPKLNKMEGYREEVGLNVSYKVKLAIFRKLKAKPLDNSFLVSIRRYTTSWKAAYSSTEPDKAVDFRPSQWRKLMETADFVDAAASKGEVIRRHLGFNLYVFVSEDFVVFREFRNNHFTQKLQSTGMTIALNHKQWRQVKCLINSIAADHYPEVNEVKLCRHNKQKDFLNCDCCNPEGRMGDWFGEMKNWETEGPASKRRKISEGFDEVDDI